MLLKEAVKIKSKKGNDIIIFDLESYGREQIQLGKYKETNNDYKITCPYCINAYLEDSSYSGPYTEYKLYVYKDFHQGHCFRCGQVFISNDISMNFRIPYPDEGKGQLEFKLVKLNANPWNLNFFNTFSQYDEHGYRYLVEQRHKYFKDLYKELNIRFINHNPVIPFYYRGELIYYQIKMAFGGGKIPYFSPPIEHKPMYIIEGGENKRFVICEGTFDAIACLKLYPDRTPCAILGSSITDYQIGMLRTYVPEDMLVYMDTTELSNKVANRIRQCVNYADVEIIKSDGQDPEEKLKEKILQGDGELRWRV
jgi:hypothetical protein